MSCSGRALEEQLRALCWRALREVSSKLEHLFRPGARAPANLSAAQREPNGSEPGEGSRSEFLSSEEGSKSSSEALASPGRAVRGPESPGRGSRELGGVLEEALRRAQKSSRGELEVSSEELLKVSSDELTVSSQSSSQEELSRARFPGSGGVSALSTEGSSRGYELPPHASGRSLPADGDRKPGGTAKITAQGPLVLERPYLTSLEILNCPRGRTLHGKRPEPDPLLPPPNWG